MFISVAKRILCSMVFVLSAVLLVGSAHAAEPIKERSAIVEESVKGATAKVAELSAIAIMYQYTGRAGDALVLYTGLLRVYGPELPSLGSQ